MLNVLSELEQSEQLPSPPQPARAEWRDGEGRLQIETTYLVNFTPHGATLMLSRRPEIGQLMLIALPDAAPSPQSSHIETSQGLLALVWALAEPSSTMLFDGAWVAQHPVSVLFLGNSSAASFSAAPPTQYAFVAEESGQFRLLPRAATTDSPPPRVNQRGESRLIMPVEITVEALDENGVVTARERTVTENISRRGALVLTTLTPPPNSVVRVVNEERQILINAVVRARRIDKNGIARLHLQFMESEWPLEGLC